MKKRQVGLFLSAVILLPCIFAIATENDAAKEKQDLYAKQRQNLAWTQAELTAWTSVPWDKDDTPYRRIQSQVDKLRQDGKLNRSVIEEYRKSSQSSASDPKKAFQWAYAAERFAVQANTRAEKSAILNGVELALVGARFPNTYSYARLCFLIQMKNKSFLTALKAPGEKLLKINPKDGSVKYQVAYILQVSPDPDEQKKAFDLAQELVKDSPKSMSAHTLLGWIYLSQWRKSKSKNDATKAASAYRQYLALAPPDHEFRKFAQNTVEMLEREQAKP